MDPSAARSVRRTVTLAAAVFLILVFAGVSRSWFRIYLTDSGVAPATAKDLSYLIVPPLLALLLAPFGRDAFHGVFARLRPGQLTLRTVVLAIGLGIAMRLAWWGVLIAGVSFRIIGHADPGAVVGPVLRFECPPLQLVVLNLVVMSLLTPVVEETIHRGGFLEWFRRFGLRFAITGSALLFALIHRPDSMAYAFMFGLFVGTLYVNSGSLWGPMLAHATANGMILLDWICLQAAWNPPSVTDGLIGTGLLASALTFCALGLAMLLVSKRIIGPTPDDPPASA